MLDPLPSLDGLSAIHQRRMSWAVRGKTEALKPALARDTSDQASRLRDRPGADPVYALVKILMEQADPTDNKRFTPWLVREYAAGRLILEDLGPANETLTLFQRYARRLKPEQRDIQRYENLAAAWQAVREFAERDEAQSNRAQKALDRAQAYAESRILQQDSDGFIVAVPLTEFAAKWWGRGTRWCTAADNNNHFWYYHKQAPLFVILTPGHGKFQLWVPEKECQFMDAADQPVSTELSREIWPWVRTLLLAAIEENGSVLKFIPEEHLTSEICLAAVRQNGWALEYVPKEHRTQDLCLAAVQQYGWALEWVPEKPRTQSLCAAAVRYCGKALQFVPEEHRTYDLCLAAVQQDGWALDYVPQKHRTYEMCMAAVRQHGGGLRFVPKKYRNYVLCLAAVQSFGQALEFVPERFLNSDLCLAAVQQDGEALKWLPDEYKTHELCLAAVKQAGMLWQRSCVLNWVPQEHRKHDLCLAAVKQDGAALRLVPKEHQTYDLCLTAVQQNGEALKWVPEEHQSRDLCLAAVQQNGRALLCLPQKHRTRDVYRAAVQPDGWALEFVPPEYRSYELTTLQAQHPPTSNQKPSWDLDVLTIWSERLKTAPQPSMVQHA